MQPSNGPGLSLGPCLPWEHRTVSGPVEGPHGSQRQLLPLASTGEGPLAGFRSSGGSWPTECLLLALPASQQSLQGASANRDPGGPGRASLRGQATLA